ncbi:MAG TPA: RodZ domain-containing protein [Steroidobacteraceae bacterium]|jgi:cytoskeleton protein RodZ|nr:RodZ domain-containing protein [Steroidobacteraceae bacterium]
MIEPAALPGTRLKAERERRGLSAQKAADELHLDRWVIDALEADDYQRIGAAVYAKGHLKKYAALLGLPAAEIMASYESSAPLRAEPAAAPSMLLRPHEDSQSSRPMPGLQIAAAVAIILGLGVLWWRPWHAHVRSSVGAAAPAATQAQAPDVRVAPGLVPAAAASPAMAHDGPPAVTSAVLSVPGAAPAGPAAGAAAITEPPVAPVPGTGRARLRLSFSADSWVEVHDASGRRTFAGNGLANSVKTVSGIAPMRVYLGFGNGVQLEINDRAVAIGPQFFAGDVARFEAGADGVLRRDSHPDQMHGAPPRGPHPPG